MTTAWSSSTLRSYVRIKTQRAEKGDQVQCTGSFSRWVLHKDPRARRLRRAAARPQNHARATTRVDGRPRNHREQLVREGFRSGYWIRLAGDSRLPEVTPRTCRDSSASNAQEEASPRPNALRPTLPSRMLLPRPQTLSCTRYPFRKDGAKLPRVPSPCFRAYLAPALGPRCVTETWDAP